MPGREKPAMLLLWPLPQMAAVSGL